MTKLQQQTSKGNSFFTTLPKKFIESLRWNKQNELEITLGKDKLIIKLKGKDG